MIARAASRRSLTVNRDDLTVALLTYIERIMNERNQDDRHFAAWMLAGSIIDVVDGSFVAGLDAPQASEGGKHD
jgi:hypothetical protein